MEVPQSPDIPSCHGIPQVPLTTLRVEEAASRPSRSSRPEQRGAGVDPEATGGESFTFWIGMEIGLGLFLEIGKIW